MTDQKIINQKPNQEIIFRVSFESIYHVDNDETAWEMLVTRDGKFHFVDAKNLADDQNEYYNLWLDGRYCIAKVNKNYYPQFEKAIEGFCENPPKLHIDKDKNIAGWKDYSDGKSTSRDMVSGQIALYERVLWLLNHDDLKDFKLSDLGAKLARELSDYEHYCWFLYSDDFWEYGIHRSDARDALNRMKLKIASAYSGKVSADEFAQIFEEDYAKIAAVKLPRFADDYIAIYFDEAGYLRRVECADENSAAKIVAKLDADENFKRLKEFFIVRKNDEDEVFAMLVDLANALFEGENVAQDYDLAFRIVQFLADECGRADAMYFMGLFHQEGYGPAEKNIPLAIKYYEKAIKNGDHYYAANNLGIIYATGNGIPKDAKKALKNFRIAADYGNPYATASIAKIYETGDGAPRNLKKAQELYHDAYVRALSHDVSSDFMTELCEDQEHAEEELKKLEKAK